MQITWEKNSNCKILIEIPSTNTYTNDGKLKIPKTSVKLSAR